MQSLINQGKVDESHNGVNFSVAKEILAIQKNT